MGIKGVPFGYLEFSRAIRGKHFAGRSRAGFGLPTRSGSFWNGNGVQRIAPALPSRSDRNSATADRKPPRTVERFLSETNRCNGSDRTIVTVQTEPLQPFGQERTDLPLPERYSFKDTAKTIWVMSEEVFLQKFVLKEGSENSTDSLIELLSESVTFKEGYSSIFLLSLQWVFLQSKDKYSPWNLFWSCCFDNHVKVLVNYVSTVRWFDSAIQIPWRSVVSWETSD